MTSINLTAKDLTSLNVDAVIILVEQAATKDGAPALLGGAAVEATAKAFASVLGPVGVTGKAGNLVKVPSAGLAKAPVLVLAGVGTLTGTAADAEAVRRAAGAATLSLTGKAKVAVVAPDEALTVATVEGALLGAYSYTEYRSGDAKGGGAVGAVTVVTAAGRDKDVKAGVARAQIIADAVHGTRDLVNMPPLDLFPAAYADRAVALCQGTGVTTKVWDANQLKRQGFGGLTGVGQGSTRGPRLVRLEWNGTKAKGRTARPQLALVGKGITFDSGGISIKPAAGMEAMKSDMAGSAAVLHTVLAAAALKLPVHLVGWLCIAENMPSGSAQRPSDVISIYGGRTVEVLNTDAEGRLVMADALVMASKEQSELIVDIATLTGAQVIALGNRVSAIMSNDDALRDRVFALSKDAGEQFWPMPLPEDLRPAMDSAVADIANIGDRFGGMLSAGLFLKEFVGNDDAGNQIPWAHLDIAGPALNTGGPHGYTPKGGTGVGVRTVLALAEQVAGA